MDGANGSTTFKDEKYTSELNDSYGSGGAEITTSVYRFGGSCAKIIAGSSIDLNQNYSDNPTDPVKLNFELGESAATFEAFVMGTSTDEYVLFNGSNEDPVGSSYSISFIPGNQILFKYSDGTNFHTVASGINSALALTTGRFHYLSIDINEGGFIDFRVNGIKIGVTGQLSHSINISQYQYSIGAGMSPSTFYVDEFRITKGLARYTTDFTVPKAPFPGEFVDGGGGGGCDWVPVFGPDDWSSSYPSTIWSGQLWGLAPGADLCDDLMEHGPLCYLFIKSAVADENYIIFRPSSMTVSGQGLGQVLLDSINSTEIPWASMSHMVEISDNKVISGVTPSWPTPTVNSYKFDFNWFGSSEDESVFGFKYQFPYYCLIESDPPAVTVSIGDITFTCSPHVIPDWGMLWMPLTSSFADLTGKSVTAFGGISFSDANTFVEGDLVSSGRGADFDAMDDYLEVVDPARWNLGDTFTIEFDMYMEEGSAPNDMVILQHDQVENDASNYVAMSEQKIVFWSEAGDELESSIQLPASMWLNIRYVQTPEKLQLYIDDSLDVEAVGALFWVYDAQYEESGILRIGAKKSYQSSPSQFFGGHIRNLVITRDAPQPGVWV